MNPASPAKRSDPALAPARQERKAFYDAISAQSMNPLWEVLHSLVPTEPASNCIPCLWKYAEIRPRLLRACELITAEEAVRRVLILENPGLRGSSSVTQSLFAGLQVILPGEIAPSHRHTQSALRFVVEGAGAYTAVNGERTGMRPGDFIITPSWTWHDHGSAAAEPVVWLDGLDIPMIRFFDAGFAQTDVHKSQTVFRAEGTSFARYGHNMAPLRQEAPFGATSPLFSYPYERSREALHTLERDAPVDLWDGVKLRYINPLTGGSPMPTMATFMQRLPAGFDGKPYRQTDGAVFSVVEGQGSVMVVRGEETCRFDFSQRDHFVIPAWHAARFKSESGCVLFSFSDRPVHEALGIHREERMN
jgi:gentisate 1,2-dioxygenase